MNKYLDFETGKVVVDAQFAESMTLLPTKAIAQIEREARIYELKDILKKMPETRDVYVPVNANGIATLSQISGYLEDRIKELEEEND